MFEKSIDEREWKATTRHELTKLIKSIYPLTAKYVLAEIQNDRRIVKIGLYTYRFVN